MNSVKSELVNSKSKSVENSDIKISKNSNFKVPNYRFLFRFTPLATVMNPINWAVTKQPYKKKPTGLNVAKTLQRIFCPTLCATLYPTFYYIAISPT